MFVSVLDERALKKNILVFQFISGDKNIYPFFFIYLFFFGGGGAGAVVKSCLLGKLEIVGFKFQSSSPLTRKKSKLWGTSVAEK